MSNCQKKHGMTFMILILRLLDLPNIEISHAHALKRERSADVSSMLREFVQNSRMKLQKLNARYDVLGSYVMFRP